MKESKHTNLYYTMKKYFHILLFCLFIVFGTNANGKTNVIPVELANGIVDESKFIYEHGFGEYLKAGANTYAELGKAIATDLSRPLSKQLQDLGNTLSNPAFYEDFAANAALIFIAKSVAAPASETSQVAKTTTALKESGKEVAKTVAKEIAEEGNKLAIRSDIVLSGGRAGQFVKTLEGPANSVLKGSGSKNRIFITDDAGKVIWDITKDRAKPVIPGKGFGKFDYGKVSQEHLDLINKVWGQ